MVQTGGMFSTLPPAITENDVIQHIVHSTTWECWTDGSFGPRLGLIRSSSYDAHIRPIDIFRMMRLDPEELEMIFSRTLPIGTHAFTKQKDPYGRAQNRFMFMKCASGWLKLARLVDKTIRVYLGLDPEKWDDHHLVFEVNPNGEHQINPRHLPSVETKKRRPSRVQMWFESVTLNSGLHGTDTPLFI